MRRAHERHNGEDDWDRWSKGSALAEPGLGLHDNPCRTWQQRDAEQAESSDLQAKHRAQGQGETAQNKPSPPLLRRNQQRHQK